MSTTLLGEASSDGVGRILTFEHAALSGRIECEHRPGIQALRPDADGTCDRTWPSSLALAQWLCDHPQAVRGQRVVELGAGTGLVGIVCAALGADVTLTDMPDALELCERNCARSPYASHLRVRACTWGNSTHLAALLADGAFDSVVCCETVYQQSDDVLHAHAHTQHALAKPRTGKVLLAYEFRGAIVEDLPYFEAATELFGESCVHALDSDIAAASGTDHRDDGRADRSLFVYSTRVY